MSEKGMTPEQAEVLYGNRFLIEDAPANCTPMVKNICPIGADVVAKAEIYDTFMKTGGPDYMLEFAHGYTYSAHPLAVVRTGKSCPRGTVSLRFQQRGARGIASHRPGTVGRGGGRRGR